MTALLFLHTTSTWPFSLTLIDILLINTRTDGQKKKQLTPLHFILNMLAISIMFVLLYTAVCLFYLVVVIYTELNNFD